jgi:tRNA (guanine37-N1)-methyltransferase
MRIEVVSLFPALIQGVLAHGVVGRAIGQGRLAVHCVDPREFATDVHRTVDDRPYGGGPGMVLKVEPLREAMHKATALLPQGARRVYLSAQGRVFDQQLAREACGLPGLVLLAGRYEGIDERVIETHIDDCWSIGDYVLSGGELPALVVIDAIARLLPGTLGDAESALQESFSDGLLEWPQYTRPESIDERSVPAVLLSGDHGAIRRWRLKQALGRTWLMRPDLLQRRGMSGDEVKLLEEFKAERECERQVTKGAT